MAFMGTESASSSSSSIMSGFKYDVFLSFRGSDTRKNFTDHLYAALNQKGIFTFRDDEKLEHGTFIAPELLRAIEESRFAVVIISQDYASSSWCLVELAKIVECMEKARLIVLPVFHYIDPSDVRNLKNTFGEAFAEHEVRFKDNIEEVYKWKAALTQVAKIAGWDLRDKHEANVVEEMVRKISNKLISTYSIVHKDFVGINSRMEELVNLLGMGLNEVRFIGIWGMGGLGKTTLAQVVYHRFHYCFEGSSFIANVREECGKHGLVHLQKRLLFDILIERNIDFSDVQWGSNVIENRLCNKSVLIVLDDVDQLDQLEALAGERFWFGRGSRVIITTRDQHLLIKHDVAEAEIYKAKELNSDEALQLFSRNAFKKNHPSEGYVELSKKAICYAQGLPLALKVLGSFLKCRKPDAWESALGRLKGAPQKTILDTLHISFDGLEETEKQIFLDIACFFKGEDIFYVTNILQTPCYKPSIDIDVLVEKSLITILGTKLWMHDLLQELGRQIVHREILEQPGKCSRLWLMEDVSHVQKNCTGSKKFQGIMLHSGHFIAMQLHTEAFRRMKNLKFLIVENVHICEPLEYLPKSLTLLKWPHYPFLWQSEYFSEQLVAIEMPRSRIRFSKLIKQERRLEEYETLPKHLKRLFLYCSLFPLGYEFGKEEMVQLWIAEGFIKERQRMEGAGCEYFDYLVKVKFIQLSRYDYSVDFYSFLSDEFDSNGGKKLYKVSEAQASHLKMAISEGRYQSVLGDTLDVVSELTRHLSLPCESINGQIEALKRCTNLRTLLLLSGCGYNVKQVPRDLFLCLKLLRTLNLSRTLISELPSSIGNVKSLRYLDVSNTHIRRLPESIDCLSNLQTLKLKGCLDFVALPKNMKKLTNLRHLELDIVRQLISMPNRIGNLTNLQTLSAFLVGRDDECGIEELKNMNDLCGTFCISRLERVSSLDKAKEAALIDKMYLHKLELRWSDIRVVNPEEEEEILESLRPHSRLKEIQILFYGGFKIPSWICDPSFADLVAITLYKCRNCEFLPSLGDLPSLKFLFIREMNEVKKIDHQFCGNGSDKGFAKLEKLEINVMLNLEEWMGVENGDLPVLRKLTVEYLPKLIALPSLSCLNSLEHLEIKRCSRLQCLPNEGLPTSLAFLLIKDCPELKERCCNEEGLDWGKIEHVPHIWIDHQEISSSWGFW